MSGGQRVSPMALTHHVARVLRTRILDGIYREGDRLQPEVALAADLDVSRETVRRALDVLQADGLVSREQGRGTFVRRVPVRRRGYTFRGDLEEFLRRSTLGREPDAELAVTAIDRFPREVTASLGEGSFGGKRVERVLTEGGAPYGYLIDHVPTPYDAHITVETLAHGGVAQALDGAGVAIELATQSMGAAHATAEVAERLGLLEGSAVLLIERSLHTDEQKIAAFTLSYYVGDLYRDVIEFA